MKEVVSQNFLISCSHLLGKWGCCIIIFEKATVRNSLLTQPCWFFRVHLWNYPLEPGYHCVAVHQSNITWSWGLSLADSLFPQTCFHTWSALGTDNSIYCPASPHLYLCRSPLPAWCSSACQYRIDVLMCLCARTFWCAEIIAFIFSLSKCQAVDSCLTPTGAPKQKCVQAITSPANLPVSMVSVLLNFFPPDCLWFI